MIGHIQIIVWTYLLYTIPLYMLNACILQLLFKEVAVQQTDIHNIIMSQWSKAILYLTGIAAQAKCYAPSVLPTRADPTVHSHHVMLRAYTHQSIPHVGGAQHHGGMTARKYPNYSSTRLSLLILRMNYCKLTSFSLV